MLLIKTTKSHILVVYGMKYYVTLTNYALKNLDRCKKQTFFQQLFVHVYYSKYILITSLWMILSVSNCIDIKIYVRYSKIKWDIVWYCTYTIYYTELHQHRNLGQTMKRGSSFWQFGLWPFKRFRKRIHGFLVQFWIVRVPNLFYTWGFLREQKIIVIKLRILYIIRYVINNIC